MRARTMRPPRLRTILVLVSAVIIALPLGSIGFFRLYESTLVRQTESELIAQGAFVAAAYKAALLRAGAGRGTFSLPRYGLNLPIASNPMSGGAERWRPQPAKLELATDPILPPPLPPHPGGVPDPLAFAAGQEITALMREAQNTTLAAIRVVDHRGTVVASTGEELGLSLSHREEIERALSGEHVSLMRRRISDEPVPPVDSISRGTGIRVFVAVPIVERERVLGAVLVARTPSSLRDTVYRKRWLLIPGALFVMAAALAVALLTAFTIARPLRAVITQTERAVRGEKRAVVPLSNPGTREVEQLSEAVAKLARTLEDRADYIRDFAAHVSHEFKTPLTAIQGAVELLREHGATMTEDERTRFLNNLSADTVRLDRLVRRLLELARADVLQPTNDITLMGPLLERLAQRYRKSVENLWIEDRSGNAAVAMAEETLESILDNLLDNACQHGGTGVAIQVHAESDGADRVRIVVRDNGPGVSPANQERVFQPFFTTARDRGGTGLGLAVVKSLLAAHNGRIGLRPADQGAVFEVVLPRC